MSPKQDVAESPLELEPEIAHLLLIDIVGYSTLSVNAQVELVQALNCVVRETDCFRKAEAQGRFIKVPTGDGMALLFFRSPEEPVRCALEIARTLKENPELKIRMGVHSGPVNAVKDVNDRSNVAGAGINVAQRVMDCGDAGHILLSKHVADDLEQYRHWKPFLQDLGECEVKHGLKLSLVNLYKEGLGNPAVPQKLQHSRWRKTSRPATRRLGIEARPGTAMAAIALLFVLAIAISAWIFHRRGALPLSMHGPPAAEASPIAEKSVAVLPFRNVGADSENEQLVEGLHDEVLTDLGKIEDLKVISRTSVMPYHDAAAQNLRAIGTALGVRYVVEGSVQRQTGRVRVTAKLIDAQNDRQLWGEHYDRDVADIFAIESDVAQHIVGQLQTKLSPSVKEAIERPPTIDVTAFELYARATDLIERSVYTAGRADDIVEAVRLLEAALKRDPAFFLAYFQLARSHDQIYWLGLDHTPGRLAMAKTAIEEMQRLRPDAGETHLALARHLYWGYLDYDGARAEVALARRALPNDSAALLLAGYIDRRQSRWQDSTLAFEHALALDPRNVFVLRQLVLNYQCLRRYSGAEQIFDRALLITPTDAVLRAQRAGLEVDWHADLKPLALAIAASIAEDPAVGSALADQWLLLAEYQREPAAAHQALAVLPPDGCHNENIPFPRAWCEGSTAEMSGDQEGARIAYTRAREEVAKLVQEQPNYAEALCALGIIDAALGHKKDALREGRRAAELVPVAKDSITGAQMLEYLVYIYIRTGEKDLALQQLAELVKVPSYLSYGQLQLHPFFDPIRRDPRFEAIVASLAPK